MSEEVKSVATYLTPAEVEALEMVKQYYGIKSTADILRSLITKEARAIREGSREVATAGVR